MKIITKQIKTTQTNHRDKNTNEIKGTYEKPYLFVEKGILEKLGSECYILDSEALDTMKNLFELFISANKRVSPFNKYFFEHTTDEQKRALGQLGERLGVV
ncbi:hypothetical protein [Candidatus Lokiarchaeum ossiferum]|uniref:hypothetical protein n=1 Tax=Candidatus Lokiarchaeum ossiferum TaxID=2951803 RepID=UPI00352DCAC6